MIVDTVGLVSTIILGVFYLLPLLLVSLLSFIFFLPSLASRILPDFILSSLLAYQLHFLKNIYWLPLDLPYILTVKLSPVSSNTEPLHWLYKFLINRVFPIPLSVPYNITIVHFTYP